MTHIIFGPPGTGKTEKLIRKVESYIKEGVDPDKIGYFTFSKNATEEAHKRMFKNFGLTFKDLPYFRTLHSLGFKQLGFDKTKVMKTEHYKEIGKNMGIEVKFASWNEDQGGIFHSDCPHLSLIELARSKNISIEEQYNKNEHSEDLVQTDVFRFAKEINNFKRDRPGMVDFTDMINQLVETKKFPKLKVAFVDEAQDLSLMQWKLVEGIKNNSEMLYVAGDDDQCIYKWRGANVESFLNLKGSKEILTKSYRVPKEVFNTADKIINRIPKNKRVQKTWMPTDKQGSVDYHDDISQIKFSTGEWLVLGRDRWKLDEFEQHFQDHNIFYERSKKDNPLKDKFEVIDLYENKLKQGQYLAYDECHSIKKKMLNKHWTNKMFKAMVPNKMYNMDMLKKDFGLNTDERWQVALSRIGENDTIKIEDLLKKGESLIKGARIKLATIHGVKGNEKQNVVLPLCLSKSSLEAYEKDATDEHRLMYVGATRSKESLHIIYPKKGGYQI
jgi:superfamily I DNA/RNA helicase